MFDQRYNLLFDFLCMFSLSLSLSLSTWHLFYSDSHDSEAIDSFLESTEARVGLWIKSPCPRHCCNPAHFVLSRRATGFFDLSLQSRNSSGCQIWFTGKMPCCAGTKAVCTHSHTHKHTDISNSTHLFETIWTSLCISDKKKGMQQCTGGFMTERPCYMEFYIQWWIIIVCIVGKRYRDRQRHINIYIYIYINR